MMKITILALLIPVAALAGNAPKSPPSAPTHITNGANSASVAASRASSIAESSATAEASQSQTAQGGSAEQSQTNEGNTLSSSYTERRQAPSVGQGSLMVGSCGAGGNGGGSNSRGSAFLGLAWTPADCKLLLAAGAYQALGMYDSACEMVNGISAVKKRWKALGVEPPKCEVKQPDPVQPVVPVTVNVQAPDLSKLATKDEVERAFGRSVGK